MSGMLVKVFSTTNINTCLPNLDRLTKSMATAPPSDLPNTIIFDLSIHGTCNKNCNPAWASKYKPEKSQTFLLHI